MRIVRTFLAAVLAGLAPLPALAVDPLVELGFWSEMSSAASGGIRSYQKLQAETAMWKAEISRLKGELDKCRGCDRTQLESELAGWQQTQQSFQQFTGSVLAGMGYDANVMRFLGVENPGSFSGLQATGRRDRIDLSKQPRPAWLEDTTPMCKGIFDQWMQCSQAAIDAGRSFAACKEIDRLVAFCGEGDLAGLQDRLTVLELRKAGIAIPEVNDAGWYLEVDYGVSSPEVTPRVAKSWQMRAYMDKNWQRRFVAYRFDRQGGSFLQRAEYTRFNLGISRDLASKCSGRNVKPEHARACDKLKAEEHGMRADRHIGETILQCDYGTRASGIERYLFWLGRRPSFAATAASLSPEVGRMTVAHFCPMSEGAAQALANGRLSPEREAALDYTLDLRDLEDQADLPSKEEYTPGTVLRRLAGLAEAVEAADLTAEELDRERARRMALLEQQVGRAEQAAQAAKARAEEERNAAETAKRAEQAAAKATAPAAAAAAAAAIPPDIVGIRLHMTRVEALAALADALGPVRAEYLPPVNDDLEMLRDTMHYIAGDGSLVILAFDGPGQDSQLMAAARTIAAEPTRDLWLAFKEKYADWGLALPAGSTWDDEPGLAMSAEATCTLNPTNLAGPMAFAGVATDLHKAVVGRSAISLRYNAAAPGRLRDCPASVRVDFREGAVATLIADFDMIERRHIQRLEGAAKPKAPKL